MQILEGHVLDLVRRYPGASAAELATFDDFGITSTHYERALDMLEADRLIIGEWSYTEDTYRWRDANLPLYMAVAYFKSWKVTE